MMPNESFRQRLLLHLFLAIAIGFIGAFVFANYLAPSVSRTATTAASALAGSAGAYLLVGSALTGGLGIRVLLKIWHRKLALDQLPLPDVVDLLVASQYLVAGYSLLGIAIFVTI